MGDYRHINGNRSDNKLPVHGLYEIVQYFCCVAIHLVLSGIAHSTWGILHHTYEFSQKSLFFLGKLQTTIDDSWLSQLCYGILCRPYGLLLQKTNYSWSKYYESIFSIRIERTMAVHPTNHPISYYNSLRKLLYCNLTKSILPQQTNLKL